MDKLKSVLSEMSGERLQNTIMTLVLNISGYRYIAKREDDELLSILSDVFDESEEDLLRDLRIHADNCKDLLIDIIKELTADDNESEDHKVEEV